MKKIVFIIIFSITAFFNVCSQEFDSLGNSECDSIFKSNIQTQVMFKLTGRMVKNLPVPKNINCDLGTFSFNFFVDRSGRVVECEFLTKKSSIVSNLQLEELKKIIYSLKFSIDNSAPIQQKGVITYVFSVKKE